MTTAPVIHGDDGPRSRSDLQQRRETRSCGRGAPVPFAIFTSAIAKPQLAVRTSRTLSASSIASWGDCAAGHQCADQRACATERDAALAAEIGPAWAMFVRSQLDARPCHHSITGPLRSRSAWSRASPPSRTAQSCLGSATGVRACDGSRFRFAVTERARWWLPTTSTRRTRRAGSGRPSTAAGPELDAQRTGQLEQHAAAVGRLVRPIPKARAL